MPATTKKVVTKPVATTPAANAPKASSKPSTKSVSVKPKAKVAASATTATTATTAVATDVAVTTEPTVTPVPVSDAVASVVVAETGSTSAPVATDADSQSVNDVFNSVLQDLNTLTQQCKVLTTRVKDLQRQVNRDHKELAKKGGKKKSNDGQKRAPSGFAKPSRISTELAKFLNVNQEDKLARTEVTKMITSYVKEHNLQNPANKKIIVPDAKLKKILKSGNEEVSFFNLQKFMKVHYLKDEPTATPTATATATATV